MPNTVLGDLSKFVINGNEMNIKDAALTETVDEIIYAIQQNNQEIGDRINDLNTRLETIEDTDYVGVTSFNGETGAITYTAPVTSVNGQTGVVNLTIPTVNDSTVTLTMNGNTVGIFTLNKSGNTTIDLGTVLTSHQSIKTINNQTITGTGNLSLNTLPTVSASDNGKVLMVVNGAWTLVNPVTLYSGSSVPNNSQGNNGDIYVQS